MFCKTRLECIRNLAEEIHSNHYEDPIKGFTPLHYVLENCFAFSDKTYALELFKICLFSLLSEVELVIW